MLFYKSINKPITVECFNNQGSIVGHQSLNINANNLINENGGLIKGDYVQLSTKNNLNNLSATIGADSAMKLDVGGDLNNQSLTYTTSSAKGASTSTRTGISQIASIYVGDGLKDKVDDKGNPLNTFIANVGGDTTFAAGRLDNQGGSSVIDTKGNVKLDAVNVGYQSNSIGDANNYFKQGESADIGSQLRGNDDIIIKAGNNINGTAVDINSSKGTVGIMADGNVDFKEGRNKQNLSTANKSTSKGFLSKTTTQNRYDMQSDNAISSNIEGDKVFVKAGQDINFTGTNAISDRGTQLSAGRDVNILAAENTSSESSFSQTKKSGLFGTSGGLGFTIGKQQTDDSNASTALTHTASNVGAIDGNVIVDAGRNYQQTGSNIVAGMGTDSNKDINSADRGNTVIRAQNINIDNTMDVYTNQSEQKFKQSGLTVAVSNSLVDNAKSIDRLVDAGGDTDSMRMKGMAGVAAVLKTKALAKEANSAGYDLLDGNLKGAGNSRIQATIGSSKSQSNSSSYREENQGSSIDTNNLALIATGAGADSNININGSSLTVSNDALFQADNDLNVNGVAQNSNTRSNNKNSSTAIGAYASTGNGMGITASASRGKGYANSDSITYANSQINVGGTTTFDIGRDVNIKGGVINTDRAQGAIGGDVNIESLQDTATYDSKQKNMGFSADLDMTTGKGSSLSVNGGKTNLNADYQAVGEQSGLFTGDGGLDITAKGKTTLIGGAITTTEAARDAGRNNYESLGGITTQDIENTTSYEGDAIQVGVSIGQTDNKPQASMNGLGYGKDSDSDSSVTRAGITGIAGNKDITTNNRAEYAGILKNNFDANQVNKELDAQTQITQEFGKEAPKAVGDYASNRQLDLINEGRVDEADKWAEGGSYRVALHTLVGAIATGSVEGALASGTTAVSIPAVDAYLEKQDVDETTRDALLLGLSAAAGAVVGGDTASTATSFSQTQNNYLTHKQIAEWGKELESCVKNRGSQCTVSAKEAINNKYTRKSEQQQQELKLACGVNGNARKCDIIRNNYYNVEGIPYDKQADKYAPKIISYGYGSKASSKLGVIQTMHNMEAEGIFTQQTANQEREKGRSGKAFAMEMAPVIAGSVIAGKMGSSRGTIKPSTNEKGTSPNNIGRNNSNYDKSRHEKISNNNQTPHKSPRPLDNPNAVQTSIKRFPEVGQKPNTILYRKNNNNTVTSYATYDSRGMIIKRVDVTGAPHKDKNGKPIPTPHVLDYGRATDNNGIVRPNKPSKAVPRPAYPDEIQYIK